MQTHTFPEFCSQSSFTFLVTRKVWRYLKSYSMLVEKICTPRYLQSLFTCSFDFYWSWVLREIQVLPVLPSHVSYLSCSPTFISLTQKIPLLQLPALTFTLDRTLTEKKKGSQTLQSFPKFPDLPVKPQGWCISPSIASSFVLQREYHDHTSPQERLEKFSSQLSREISTCFVNVWSLEVDDAPLCKHQSHAMMQQWCIQAQIESPNRHSTAEGLSHRNRQMVPLVQHPVWQQPVMDSSD